MKLYFVSIQILNPQSSMLFHIRYDNDMDMGIMNELPMQNVKAPDKKESCIFECAMTIDIDEHDHDTVSAYRGSSGLTK